MAAQCKEALLYRFTAQIPSLSAAGQKAGAGHKPAAHRQQNRLAGTQPDLLYAAGRFRRQPAQLVPRGSGAGSAWIA